MSDAIACHGVGCPIKERCRRYSDQLNRMGQTYFRVTPFKIIHKKFECDMYWGESSDLLFEQVKGIVGGE